MSEFKRLRDGGDAEMRTAMLAAKREAPSAAAKRAVLVAATVAMGVKTVAPVSLASPRFLRFFTAPKIGWMALTAVAASSGYVVGRRHERTEQAASVVKMMATPAPPTTLPELVVETQPPRVGVAKRKEKSLTPSLSIELQSLGHAREALLLGDVQGATAALDDYVDKYPHGALEEEALALRVRALRAAGDDTLAFLTLESLAMHFPDSIYLPVLKNR